MNNPIKVIHKFKNNNRRIQYIVYIFVGSLISDDIKNILNDIKKKDFYDTLNYLSKVKVNLLESNYGKKWYLYFFNKYHINKQKSNITKNINKKNTLINKFGKEWFQENIQEIDQKKVKYSFASNYYDYLIARNKIKTKVRKVETDFRTYDMKGGFDEENIINEDNIDEKIEQEDEEEPVIKNQEDLDDEVVDDFNLDELTKLYSMKDIENEKSVLETAKLISEATKDKSWIQEKNKSEIDFNNKLEDIQYDVKLEDIYEKTYIMNEFIFYDDNITTIRNKITVSLSLSEKFGSGIKFLPEYQYLWSEYDLEDKMDRIMLGQKWIRRNELLKIDIKPNENLSVYENLRNNLSYLKESFGIKIKREDDENLILRDYEDYITSNEIYLIDILNELGLNYSSSSDKKRNLYEVFINIYFPFITFEHLEDIINLLNGTNKKELERNINFYNQLVNDVKLENEIYNIVEETKLDTEKYNKMFNQTFILQTIIHINLSDPNNLTGTVSKEKFDLYKIFDNFIVNEEYPFIQYQTPDSQLTYKFYTKTKNVNDNNIFAKWFENAPYGISFKINIDKENNKYISINMNENGRIEYKITWTESDQATIEDIKKSYIYVINLLNKINSENKKIKIIIPNDDQFKYAFINTIQKFMIPDKFKIDHNDLSDFCRFFYTYISLVIEPKKRVAKVAEENKSSKYGTYLRYKKISNYENKTRMHLRMLYFLRNYEITDRELVDEISKQFNITQEDSAIELDIVKKKFSKVLEKTKTTLKKLKLLPKSKPPGIGIDIQGRTPDKYKIRITGARSKTQLNEIISFVKVLIYLYYQTYLLKNTKFQKIKDKLLKLSKVAKRRNKVREIVNYDNTMEKVKDITSLDKKRLGFKPEEGQNQWTRSCQNSGNDKKRRPLIVSSNDVKKLEKRGYKLNPKTNNYEKTVVQKIKDKNKTITVRAVKLTGEDGNFNYFTCDPDENKEHAYIGFLSKSSNPNDLCMPCCFKKDQMVSSNKVKKNYYLKCTGEKSFDEKVEKAATSNMGDKIYILQETNKIQEGRFIFLKDYLNKFFNSTWNHDKIIKNHYLIQSNSGYYLKFTVKDNNYFFLAAIANIFDLTIDQIKTKCITTLENDKDDKIFTYLNNGDTKSLFNSKEGYIDYIKNSNHLEYDILGELLAVPNVISEKGVIYFIIEKKIKIIMKKLEKDTFKENFFIKCLNIENNYQLTEDRDIIILIKDGKYYFPIYRVRKKAKVDKNIYLQKKYNIDDKETKNVINELFLYYNKSCLTNFMNFNNNINIYNKEIINLLTENKIKIKTQIINDRNKVRYIHLDSNLLLPVTNSGVTYENNIVNIKDIKETQKLDIKTIIKLLKDIESKIKLNYIPSVIYYNNFTKDKTPVYSVTSLLLKNKLIIPIKKENLTASQFKKFGLSYEFQSLEETIENEIINKTEDSDNRDIRVREKLYRNESYNLLRLELSLFLNTNIDLRKQIISMVRNKDISKKNKKNELYSLVVNIINPKLNKKLSSTNKKESIAEITKKIPEVKNYSISNIRNYCKIHKKEDTCNKNEHCVFINNTCKFLLFEGDSYLFIQRIIEEMIQDKIKFKEIIQEDDYYVSDIVDYTQYSNRPDQKIIKTTNFNIKKIMSELFGKNSIPRLGKNRLLKKNTNIEEDYIDLVKLGDQLIQEVIGNRDSIIRAYVNSYYWLNNPLYDIESRNLGYKSELQDQITNLFKANIIDYIQNNVYNNELAKDLKEYLSRNDNSNFFLSAINKFRKNINNTDGILELTLLSYIFNYPIVVYNNFNKVKYIFSNGMVKVNEKTIKKYESEKSNTIFLKFNFEGKNVIPKEILAIYYEK